MGNAYKREVKDWRGVVIGCDVGRFFPIEAHAAADRAEALLNGINPAGFVATPFGAKGEPFDPPEVVLPPNCGLPPTPSCSYPECNCPFDHPGIKGWCARGHATAEYPSGYRSASETLAHAQHEAATDGDDCTSGACLITRGSD